MQRQETKLHSRVGRRPHCEHREDWGAGSADITLCPQAPAQAGRTVGPRAGRAQAGSTVGPRAGPAQAGRTVGPWAGGQAPGGSPAGPALPSSWPRWRSEHSIPLALAGIHIRPERLFSPSPSLLCLPVSWTRSASVPLNGITTMGPQEGPVLRQSVCRGDGRTHSLASTVRTWEH